MATAVEIDFDVPFYLAKNQRLQPKCDAMASVAPHAITKLHEFDRAQLTSDGAREQTQKRVADLLNERREQAEIPAHIDRVIARGVKPDKHSDAACATAFKEIERNDREIARLRKTLSRPGFSSPLGNFWKVFEENPGEIVDGRPNVEVPTDSTPAMENERCNAEIAELQNTRKNVERTSLPLEDIRAKVIDDIETRAAENAPKFEPLFQRKGHSTLEGIVYRGFGSIKWPTDYAAENQGARKQMDDSALIFWAMKDTILAKALAEVERLYKPEKAMTDAQRKARIAEIDAEILRLDYEAVAFLDIAAAEGIKLPYRQGVDPFAVLQIKFELAR